uniref:Uncharacterized protein n=1 Tax=Plectus sambesii TaxID=2011161 RepID=A0A914XMI5_9BILA
MLLLKALLACLVANVRPQESSPLPEAYLHQSSYQKQLRDQSGQAELDYDQSGWEDYNSGNQQTSSAGHQETSSACCGPPQPCCPYEEAPPSLGTCCLVPPPCCRPKPCCPASNFWPFPVYPRWPQRSFYLLRRPLDPYSVYRPPPPTPPCCPWKRQPCCPSPPCCPIKPCCEVEIPYCRRACPECPCRQALRRRAKRLAGCVSCRADGLLQRAKRTFGQDHCDSSCRGSPSDPYHHSRFKRTFGPNCVFCYQSPFSAATMLQRTKRTAGDQCVACTNPLLHGRRRKRTLDSGCLPCESPYNDGGPFGKTSRTKRQSVKLTMFNPRLSFSDH